MNERMPTVAAMLVGVLGAGLAIQQYVSSIQRKEKVAQMLTQTAEMRSELIQRQEKVAQTQALVQLELEDLKKLADQVAASRPPLEVTIESLVRELQDEGSNLRIAIDDLLTGTKAELDDGETPGPDVAVLVAELEKLREILKASTPGSMGTLTLDKNLPTNPQASDYERIRPGMSTLDVLTLLGYPDDVFPSSDGTAWRWEVTGPEGVQRPGLVFRDGVVVSTFD